MDAVIHGEKVLAALVITAWTAWCLYAGIIGAVDGWKHREGRLFTIFFSLMAIMFALLLAWLDAKLLKGV